VDNGWRAAAAGCHYAGTEVPIARHERSGKGTMVIAMAASPRFLQLADVAEVLNISAAQAYALVRSGELPAIKIGGRGQWRVEASELESYIQRRYDETRSFVAEHPFGRADGGDAMG
jgi:excisionase family DNA binding protein